MTAEGLAKLLPWKPEREYILYQTSIAHLPTGPVSTYTVSYDPGYPWKLAGVLCMSTGIFLMFYTGGYFRWSKTTQRLVGLGGFAALVAIGWFLSNSWMVVGVNAAVAAFPTLSSSLVRRPELAGANS